MITDTTLDRTVYPKRYFKGFFKIFQQKAVLGVLSMDVKFLIVRKRVILTIISRIRMASIKNKANDPSGVLR